MFPGILSLHRLPVGSAVLTQASVKEIPLSQQEVCLAFETILFCLFSAWKRPPTCVIHMVGVVATIQVEVIGSLLHSSLASCHDPGPL